MGWKPDLNSLVCPFCGQSCDFPELESGPPVRFGDHLPGFDREELRASCGCGSFVIVDAEIQDDEDALRMWATKACKELDTRVVAHVDFYGPAAYGDGTPREPESEWDGEWADALFYRLVS